ncbi:sensor histidine kinase [Paenibacillus elgii]|uniref:sensor histidine kinase n=1 Tax=Paenibacillus elgii TaxID=189691 RepID=UPI0013D16FCD|nr:HAMP domain-containing sensor histidine kinase [Paenibacillus elgii]
MKHWPLAVKLWGIFTALTIGSFSLLAVLLPWTLKDFFTEQLYDSLLDQSQMYASSPPPFLPSDISASAIMGMAGFREMISRVAPESEEMWKQAFGERELAENDMAKATQERTKFKDELQRSFNKKASPQNDKIDFKESAAAGVPPTFIGKHPDNGINGGKESELSDKIKLLETYARDVEAGDTQAIRAEDAEAIRGLLPKLLDDYRKQTASLKEAAARMIIEDDKLKAEGTIKKTEPFLPPPNGPSVQHLMLSTKGSVSLFEMNGALTSADPLVRTMAQDARLQQAPVQKYMSNIEGKLVFYVIRIQDIQGGPGFMVSYTTSNYRNDLVMAMFGRLALLMAGLIVLSWLPCLGLAQYLTRPLVQMERHVGRLARRDWHEPLETVSKDEIGRLGSAIETMRQQLVRQDKTQQFFLQNISHELKTPVMVIRSYAQSIMDGVFPRKTLAGSVDVIMKESERLEKRIRDLLYLNKLNYFTSREKPHQPFDLKALLDDTVERLRYRRADIAWEVSVPDAVMLTGDREQWGVALENLTDNQLRYAQTCIRLEVKPGGAGAPIVRLWNDGPPLDEETEQSLFEPFRTGGDGQFGLGLAIVRQIAANHGYAARAANEEGGVTFYLEPGASV